MLKPKSIRFTLKSQANIRFRFLQIAIAAVAIVLIIVSYIIGTLHIKQQQTNRRLHVIEELNTIGNRLEGIVRSTFNLTQGMVHLIRYQGNISTPQFEALCKMAMEENSYIRNVALAPNNVVEMVYPLKGNEKAIGLSYLERDDQKPSVIRAMELKSPILAGPVNLVQGGVGLINRSPVCIECNSDSEPKYWGVVSVVAHYDAILYDAGIFSSRTLRIALQGHDGLGSSGKVIAGDSLLLDLDPVIIDVMVPGGSWRLIGIPSSGWGENNIFNSNYFIISMVITILIVTFLSILIFINQKVRYKNLQLAQEIGERNKIEHELKQAKEAAEEANRVKSVFLANMSHEIRTPMNAIQGFTDLILRGSVDPDSTMDYIEIINNSAKQLLGVINDIIDVSIIEVGHLKIIDESVILNGLLNDIHLLNYNNAKIKGINLLVRCGLSDGYDTITIDGHRLSQIINNLVSNALKFTASGSVEFGYTVEGKNLKFFVSDTGIGIPEQYHQVIFERFRQADEQLSRNYGGVGLGLSICKSIIEIMGGQIWFESEVNKGTTFYFTLPYLKEQSEVSPKVDFDKHIGNYKGKNILIAEDDDFNYMLLEVLVEKTQASVLRACNGQEAVEIFDSHPGIDLVLMDIKMPVMNGYEAIALIRKRNGKVPIIAQSAFAMAEEKQFAINAGCNYYITKPINHQELYDTLKSVFGV